MDRIPSNSLDPSDGRFVQTFDTEGGDLIKHRTPVLESMIRCQGCRAECLPTNLALVATTLPALGLVEAMADDTFGSGFCQLRALSVWAGETLHGSWTLSTVDLVVSN
jgi:hypothetical protein